MSMALHGTTTGTGPDLILLHGLFGAGDNLGGLRRRLKDRFRVHTLDLRNHGDSPHTDAMSYPEMAVDVSDWMAAQGLEEAALLGHSMGGKVAMELALSAPQRVTRLIVADIAPVRYDPHHAEILEGLQRLDPGQCRSRREADGLLAEVVSEPRVRQFLLTNLVPQDEGFRWRFHLAALVNCYDQIMAAPEATGPYQGPVLFIKGGESDYIQEAHREAVLARFPQADMKAVPGVGHWLHAEKPDLVARLCERFLEG